MTPAQFWQIEQQNQQNRQEFMQGQMENVMQGIAQFAGAYAENKALDAKGAAYGEFLKNHGEQLGFNAEWLKDFAGRNPREQAMIGDNIIGMQNAGSWVSRTQYANTYMQPRAPRATPAYGGGGGAAPTGGSSFTF